MKLLPVYSGRGRQKNIVAHAQVSDEDFEYLSQWQWLLHKQGRGHKYLYAVRSLYLHQIVLERVLGRPLNPRVELADHINGHVVDSGLNCQRNNLRLSSFGHNRMSGEKPIKEGKSYRFIGVTWDKSNQRWVVKTRAGMGGKRLTLGLFKSEEEAAKAYDAAVRRVYPNSPWINFSI